MSQQTSGSNYDLYKVFLYVAKHKSLTKAAKELDVSQPAISQSMKQLEANLSVKLTKRTGHGIKLTEEGEILYPYIKKGCDAFSVGEKALLNAIKKPNIRFVTDCFVTGTQYSHFTGQKLPYRLLEHLPVILTKDDPTRENLNRFLKDNSIKLKPIAEYSSLEEVLYHVIRNDGIGCLPFDFVESAVKAKDAYILEFEESIPERVESANK